MESALKKHLPGGNFTNVSARRSKAMARVKGKGNKTTEWRLRAALVRAGVSGWLMHLHTLPGKPDFYFPNSHLAVFVDGCFWHGCPRCYHRLKTNTSFWNAKIKRNRERDKQISQKLRKAHIGVLRVWEHELADDLSTCVQRIRNRAQCEAK